ncbi:MAG: hypothetical protein J7M21_06230 [Planctomycetes bacterium]|nr:hypothetical protein [Planctomycetota bacterium]
MKAIILAMLVTCMGLLTRAGLHCAPLAHQAIGTFPAGTCRISFGPFMCKDHIRRVVAELDQLAGGHISITKTTEANAVAATPEDLAR